MCEDNRFSDLTEDSHTQQTEQLQKRGLGFPFMLREIDLKP